MAVSAGPFPRFRTRKMVRTERERLFRKSLSMEDPSSSADIFPRPADQCPGGPVNLSPEPGRDCALRDTRAVLGRHLFVRILRFVPKSRTGKPGKPGIGDRL